MHPCIIVIGPIGSGKSTTSQYIAQHFGYPLVDADLYHTNPFLASYIQDMPRWALATELFFTINRIKKLTPLSTQLKKTPVVVDSGLIMSHIYTRYQLEVQALTPAEWDLYTQIVADYQQHLPTPTHIIHLQAKPHTQLQRIKARGRAAEAGYTLDYLRQVTQHVNDYAHTLSAQQNTTLIPFDTDRHNIHTKPGKHHLLTALQPHLPKP